MNTENGAKKIYVHDIMTTSVMTIGPDETVTVAARRLREADVSGLPVVDTNGGLIGIVTEADLLRALARRDPAVIVRDPDQRRPTRRSPVEVQDAMSRDVVGISRDASIGDAARLLSSDKLKRLPVLGPGGELEGIVSRADIVAVLGKPDRDIEAEILASIVTDSLASDPDTIGVTVDQGIVTLTGVVSRKTQVAALAELAANVLGVSRVVDQVTWRVDDSYAGLRPRFSFFGRTGS
jgi:CBS domain-containing protein